MTFSLRFKRSTVGWSLFSLMLLIAVAALCFALIKSGAEYNKRSEHYLSLAEFHAKCAQRTAGRKTKPGFQSFADYKLAEERYHRALEQKYLQAAAKPWRVLEPDPPLPKIPIRDILKEMKQKDEELKEKFRKPRGEDPPYKQPLDVI